MYSENSKIVVYLDSFSKQIFNLRLLFGLISVFETTAHGVIKKVLPVLSTEKLLHIWLSTEYYGFRPNSTAVYTVS